MWGHYHWLRSSSTFHESWMKFVKEAVAKTPSPAFYQRVTHEVRIKYYRTDVVYENIIVGLYPGTMATAEDSTTSTHDEGECWEEDLHSLSCSEDEDRGGLVCTGIIFI